MSNIFFEKIVMFYIQQKTNRWSEVVLYYQKNISECNFTKMTLSFWFFIIKSSTDICILIHQLKNSGE